MTAEERARELWHGGANIERIADAILEAEIRGLEEAAGIAEYYCTGSDSDPIGRCYNAIRARIEERKKQ